MPLQRRPNHGFTEAATHLRRCHPWTAHDTKTAAAFTESCSNGVGDGSGNGGASSSPSQLRRPSMRPLDHRWDRSRGIVFSSYGQRRTYASKPIQRSAPTSTPAAIPTKSSSPSSAASAVDSGWKGGLIPTTYSVKQGKDLEKKIHDLNKEILGLNAKIKEHKMKIELQENQLASLRSRGSDLENKLSSARSKAQRDLADLQAKQQMELETLRPRIAENAMYRDNLYREAQAPLLGDIRRLNSDWLKSQHEVEALKTTMEDQQKRHDTAQRDAAARARELGFALNKAAEEIRGFKSRKKEDREDYTRYHNIFAELRDKTFQVRDELFFTRRRVEAEITLWQKSIQRFRTSESLRLLLHSSKYAGTKNAIEQFLEGQVSDAEKTIDGLGQLERLVVRDRDNMHTDAHHSRSLTRHHHLDEHQSAYNSAQLAHRLAGAAHFHKLRKAYTDDIRHLDSLIEGASRKSDDATLIERLSAERQELTEMCTKVRRFLTFFQFVQDWRALEALEDDDIVEKSVWVDTIKAKRALDAAVDRFHSMVEDHPAIDAKDWKKRHHYLEDVRAQRMAYDHLVAQVRQRHLLAHDLGKMTTDEQKQVEETIKRQTELAKTAVDGSLAGLGFQKPFARRSRTIQKTDQTTTTTTGASSKPPVTLDSLRAGLSTEVATKKQRVAHAEKKPTIVKKGPRKALVSRAGRKKRFPGQRRISFNSSSATAKLDREYATGDETGARDVVSGNAASVMKPTEPRQAPYRQPAYDTEVDASRVKSRASRGDNMGFSTLQAALTGKNASERPAATSSSDGDDTGTSPSPPAEDNRVLQSDDDVSMNDERSGASSEQESSAADEEPEESQTILSYQIPAKDFRDAAMASLNSNAAYWSHNLYKNAENQKPVVYYCQNYDAAEARAKLFLDERVIGFDLEWEPRASIKADSPDIKRNVSLIQIAAEGKIALFQLARFKHAKTAEDHMPPSLRKILESPSIVKAGVNVSGDARRMKKCLGVDMAGVFELSHLFRVVKQSEKVKASFKLVSLKTQVDEILLLPMKKDEVRVSAWSKELNNQQTSYAASDAYAGFQLFHKLDNERKTMVPKPPRPQFYETFQPLVLGDGTMVFRASSGKRQAVVKKDDDAVEDEVDEEEEGEFFDAPEGLDTYELGLEPEISNPPNQEQLRQTAGVKQEISYPSLPSLDSGSVRPMSSTPTQSCTTTLPLRSKLTPKTQAIPEPELTTYPADEDIQANRSATAFRPGPLPCPENQAAETWMITYRAKHSGISVGTAALRAYHLWHFQRFELKEVAGFCRDPPLAITTVASYIMQALKEAELPFDVERVNGVLAVLPISVHGRYRGVLERGAT